MTTANLPAQKVKGAAMAAGNVLRQRKMNPGVLLNTQADEAEKRLMALESLAEAVIKTGFAGPGLIHVTVSLEDWALINESYEFD